MKTVITKGIVVVIVGLSMASCAGVYNPDVVMTAEGIKGLTNYTQTVAATAKSGADLTEANQQLNNRQEMEHNTHRFEVAAKHSAPGLVRTWAAQAKRFYQEVTGAGKQQ